MAEELIKRYVKETQLNERVSATEYDVLHPETTADQVITNSEKQFVSQEEKDIWNNLAAGGLNYKGVWTSAAAYSKNDVVSYNNKFYIANQDSSGRTPSETADNTYWINFNKEAYLADRANTVDIQESTVNAEYKVTFHTNEDPNSTYETLYSGALTYNPQTETLTSKEFVGHLTGDVTGNISGNAATADRATVAEKYVEYSYDDAGNRISETGNTPDISFAIEDLSERIDNLEGGGVTLSNSLTITKDGGDAVEFDGTKDVTVDIQQSFSTEEITDLLDDNKTIDTKWLPSSILDGMRYKGVFSENGTIMSSDDAFHGKVLGTTIAASECEGCYFLASYLSANKGKGYTIAGIEDVRVGDWIVSNGNAGFVKIDNTDAVTMVNSQKGAVEIYKNWSANSVFYKGDIVKVEEVLYICNSTHTSSTSFNTDVNSYWDLFGRTYTATDGIKIENTVIKHSTTTPSSSNTNITLAAGQNFKVPVITTDAFGHISILNTETITLGTDFIDTVRAVQVNGTEVLASNVKSALNLAGDTWINLNWGNNKVNFTHKNNGSLGAIEFNSGKVTDIQDDDAILYSGQGYSIPTFEIDGAGHIIAGSMKRFRLADSLIKHNHFNITKDSDGAQTIGAYDAITATSTWVNNTNNALKFYLGNVNPTSTSKMNFNGKLSATEVLQGGNAVIDSTSRIYSGKDTNDADLYGSYNVTTKSFDMANSGIEEGVYSAVAINSKGIATAGGSIIEFGQTVGADPSASLAVGGLFFRLMSEPVAA